MHAVHGCQVPRLSSSSTRSSMVDYTKFQDVGSSDDDDEPAHTAAFGLIKDARTAREKLPKDVERQAARTLLLEGSTLARYPFDEAWMGIYCMDDVTVNGRPSYYRDDAENEWRLWASGSGQMWQLGLAKDIGTSRCALFVMDGELLPERITETWQAWVSGRWTPEPALRCRDLAAVVTELDTADELPNSMFLTGGEESCRHQRSRLGLFTRHPILVNGLPAYAKADDKACSQHREMLWWAKGGWRVGHAANLGETSCGITAPTTLLQPLLPHRFTGTWEVFSSRQDGWLDAPSLRCVDGKAMAAELGQAASTIHLVGSTPNVREGSTDWIQMHKVGCYSARPDRVNGLPSYAMAGSDHMMWWAAGSWRIGIAEFIASERCSLRIENPALLPEHATGAWKAWDGLAWVDVPELRVLSAEALAAKTQHAESTIHLVGGTSPRQIHAAQLGKYIRRTVAINEMPSFEKEGAPGTLIWWHAGRWLCGPTASAGSSRRWLDASDGSLLPEHATGMWRVWDHKASAMADVPGLRCISETALSAELVEHAAPAIHLVGGTSPQSIHVPRLGRYVSNYPKESVNGMPVYVKEASPFSAAACIWRDSGRWLCGPAGDVGTDMRWMEVPDDLLLPDRATGMWQVWDDVSQAWAEVPGLRCVSDAAMAAEQVVMGDQLAAAVREQNASAPKAAARSLQAEAVRLDCSARTWLTCACSAPHAHANAGPRPRMHRPDVPRAQKGRPARGSARQRQRAA